MREKDDMKKLVIGILAHVDAGKTTLSEGMLYTAGVIKKLGRVDHKNTFLDVDIQERERGITIFSKQAEMSLNDLKLMLLDTPGHVDFCSEMERTLQVIDYAIMVIDGKSGVQGHTLTLWRLLKTYNIPVFIFINKMDMDGADRNEIFAKLKNYLSEKCVDFNDFDSEEIALCDEDILENYFNTGKISKNLLSKSIRKRKIFPCYFGSALKLTGIDDFMTGLYEFTVMPDYNELFSAKIYKISRDTQGNRLTHMKITGGMLKVKDTILDEKINQIRIYSGEKFRTESSVDAGTVCAVAGLAKTYAGQSLGREKSAKSCVLEPALAYSVICDENLDRSKVFFDLKQLEEEDPQLHIIWDEHTKEIQIQLMGQVQMEILKNIISDRFGISVEFGEESIYYKETIKNTVVGSGHFEPLKHYAEIHLLLEPGKPGSGLIFDTKCSEDILDKNWQRLVLTHLNERHHIGVLTGSPITDMKISILAGKAHVKHTEGGDFRQATYRAIGQALRKADSVLLEPWYEFRLEVPSEFTGRAMSDINKMGGSFSEPRSSDNRTVLEGKAPVSEMNGYSSEVNSYTKGFGYITCVLSGYEPCHNQDEVIENIGYEPDKDINNTGDSVFCTNGSGFSVRWDEADDYFHVQHGWKSESDSKRNLQISQTAQKKTRIYDKSSKEEEDELNKIFEMTYGKPKERRRIAPKVIEYHDEKQKTKPFELVTEYLLVDGYNIIFAWKELKALADVNLDSAREALIEILQNYQGYRKCRIIAVFDAYKVKGGERHCEKYGNIDVVFTKEAETADTYIERMTYDLKDKYSVRVATSDNLEQMIVLGNGAFKISANEFKAEVENINKEISLILKERSRKNSLEHKNNIKLI